MNSIEMGGLLTGMKSTLPQWAPKEITKDLCTTWGLVLKDFPDEVVRSAFLEAASTLTEWPPPATIKRLCLGSRLSDEEIGKDIAGRIASAIRSCGYPSPNEAHKRIGDIGWEVVQDLGGWDQICRIESEEELKFAQRNWADRAELKSKNYHDTGRDAPPALPAQRHPALKAAINLVLNKGELA